MVMVALLIAVLFVVFRILPEKGVERLKFGRGNARFHEAQKMERQSLHRVAAETYARILGNPRNVVTVRYLSALRLADLQLEWLDDPRAAELALERACLLAPDEDAREKLTLRLETLRGTRARDEAQPLSADTRTIVAEIGSQIVTLEDLYFAWSRSHGESPAEGADFESFVRQYLDMALLADEAEQLGLAREGRTALDLRLSRFVSLSGALNGLLADRLDDPTEEQLRAFYNADPTVWSPQPPPPPFESIRDQVHYRYLATQHAIVRQNKIDELRRTRPIVLHRGAMPPADNPSTPTAAQTPKTKDTP
jgi:hypothetical protein